jgi:hypothetical protein
MCTIEKSVTQLGAVLKSCSGRMRTMIEGDALLKELTGRGMQEDAALQDQTGWKATHRSPAAQRRVTLGGTTPWRI